MKIKYDEEADVLIFIMKQSPPVDAVEEPGGIIISYDELGEPVSIEILNVSKKKLIKPEEITITFQKLKTLAV